MEIKKNHFQTSDSLAFFWAPLTYSHDKIKKAKVSQSHNEILRLIKNSKHKLLIQIREAGVASQLSNFRNVFRSDSEDGASAQKCE